MAKPAKVCAHCGESLGASVYHVCGECGEPVCETCATDPCCVRTEEHQPKSDDPAEG